MKLLVFSDSHGNPSKMLDMIRQSGPDMIIHLGDGERDTAKIEAQFPQIPLKAVRGNCDIGSVLPDAELFSVGKAKIFITHGHIYGVKRTLSALVDEAVSRGADIVMFGHTHIADYSMRGGIYVLNPGSCGLSSAPSCAEVTIDNKGEIACRIVRF
ncbi:MAG: metallophosphoesterase [Oscillospiraceae bacterium]|nr:metallophosphoesterase [Oscillospiraceae bacterium]